MSEVVYKKILVPVDGSAFSFSAAKYAIALAKPSGAEVICVHSIVNPPYMTYPSAGMMIPRYIEEAKTEASGWFDQIKAMAAPAGVKVTTDTILDVFSITDSILNYAKAHNVDLIVMGTHGRSGVKRLLMGSVASGVVAHAGCPVLVVR